MLFRRALGNRPNRLGWYRRPGWRIFSNHRAGIECSDTHPRARRNWRFSWSPQHPLVKVASVFEDLLILPLWGPRHAFIYSQAGGMQNLNDLIDPSSGWDIWAATGINDAGWICGQGVNPQGRIDAVLLVPLPEPSSLSLVTIVFAIVAGWFAVALPPKSRAVFDVFVCFYSVFTILTGGVRS